MAVPSRGRPRLPGSVHHIRLRSSVFDLWNETKLELGFEGSTNSVFAEFLLHLATREIVPPRTRISQAAEVDETSTRNSESWNVIASSTPVRPDKPRRVKIKPRRVVRVKIKPCRVKIESPSSSDGESLDVDVTGTDD